jgi:uncharacterized protein
MATGSASSTQVLDDTRRWLERAVIGLNLCPFAKAVHAKRQIHFAVSEADQVPGVLEHLDSEINALLDQSPQQRDTTLLVVPSGFDDFLMFNELVRQGERLLARRKLDGVLQLASFHPAFVFAGAHDDDMANFSNRSPWPTLHLLREDSVDRAVAAFPDAEAIYETNIRTLERLGAEGWKALGAARS